MLPWFVTTAGEHARTRFSAAIIERKTAAATDHTRTRLTAESNQPADS